EVPAKHGAILRVGAAVADGQQWDLVDDRLLGDGGGNARREGMEEGRARRTLILQALVAFHATVGGVAELAFLDEQLDAVNTAVAFVDERVVVGKTICRWH